MEVTGQVRKMHTQLDDVVQYHLPLGDTLVDMNALIGQPIQLSFGGHIQCINCGRSTKSSFAQGFCYKCFTTAPESSECIIRPELCEGHLGKGRDPQWEQKHHVQDHYVYFALSSAVKVGVTRSTQIPTRWIDQGATQAIKVALTPNRYLAGLIEVALKDHMTDKTDWRKMLRNEVKEGVDLLEWKEDLLLELDEILQDYVADDDEVLDLHYPVETYPTKVKSVSFDKLPEIEGVLKGIKGQYLLLDGDRVLNMRKHSGYIIRLNH